MPIYQTNIWVCEKCRKIVAITDEVLPYDDPVVVPPEGKQWSYVEVRKLQDKVDATKEVLVCPECAREEVPDAN